MGGRRLDNSNAKGKHIFATAGVAASTGGGMLIGIFKVYWFLDLRGRDGQLTGQEEAEFCGLGGVD